MNMIALVFLQSIQLILSLQNIGNNKHIAQDIHIANVGGNRVINLTLTLEGCGPP